MSDQAAALRLIVRNRNRAPMLDLDDRCQILSVTSGKGGVGKTNLTVNLAIAMSRAGKRVAILDADFGLANVDVFLGLTPAYHLGHVVEGIVPIQDIVLEGPEGVHVIPASSGIQEMTELTEMRRLQIWDQLRGLLKDYDYLIIDTAAGISQNVISLLELSRQIIVVSAPEPTAIVDAYALIKVLLTRSGNKDLFVVINSVRSESQAQEVFKQLSRVVQRFLSTDIQWLGYIPWDEKVHDAVRRQTPLLLGYPNAPASRCMNRISRNLIQAAHGSTKNTPELVG